MSNYVLTGSMAVLVIQLQGLQVDFVRLWLAYTLEIAFQESYVAGLYFRNSFSRELGLQAVATKLEETQEKAAHQDLNRHLYTPPN